jgi:hypothetical protein
MTKLTSTNSYKITKPNFYYSNYIKLKAWLLQWDLFFKLTNNKINNTNKISLITSYLRGEASR